MRKWGTHARTQGRTKTILFVNGFKTPLVARGKTSILEPISPTGKSHTAHSSLDLFPGPGKSERKHISLGPHRWAREIPDRTYTISSFAFGGRLRWLLSTPQSEASCGAINLLRTNLTDVYIFFVKLKS